MDLQAPSSADQPLPPPLVESVWVEPMPDGRVLPAAGDPAEIAVARESVKLAFVAALQHLPPRQRAVLILREVLRWHADEVAELLDTTVASVNSALQRARATLASEKLRTADEHDPMDAQHTALLARYVDAFERYDTDALTSLLREDAAWNMPPYAMWLQTHQDVVDWRLGRESAARASAWSRSWPMARAPTGSTSPIPRAACRHGRCRCSRFQGIGSAGSLFFLDTERLFPLFGLPDHLDAQVGQPVQA